MSSMPFVVTLEKYLYLYPMLVHLMLAASIVMFLGSLILYLVHDLWWANQLPNDKTAGLEETRHNIMRWFAGHAVHAGIWVWIMLGYGLAFKYPVDQTFIQPFLNLILGDSVGFMGFLKFMLTAIALTASAGDEIAIWIRVLFSGGFPRFERLKDHRFSDDKN